jgi:hypothetical protein
MNPPAMKVTFWKRYGVDAGDARSAARQVDDSHGNETHSREATSRKRVFLIG